MQTTHRIMLVDDSDADNFIHTRCLVAAGVDRSKVIVMTDAETALSYLQNEHKESFPLPSIIFLDINMPKVSGWEFLERYKDMDVDAKKGVIVVMLSTSLNPADRGTAENNPLVHGFINKPLTAVDFGQLAASIDGCGTDPN